MHHLQDITRHRYLVIENTFIHDIELFAPREDGSYTKTDLGYQGFYNRPVIHRYPTFPMEINPGEEQTYFLRMKVQGPFIAEMKIWDPHDFREDSYKQFLRLGLLFGGLVAMALYHGFMVFAIKDFLHLFYVAFLVFAILFELHLKGWPTICFGRKTIICIFQWRRYRSVS